MKSFFVSLVAVLMLLATATRAKANAPCAGNNISPTDGAFIGVLNAPSAGQRLYLAVGAYLVGPVSATAVRTGHTIKMVLYGPHEDGIPPPIRCVATSIEPLPAGHYTVDLYTIYDPDASEIFATRAALDVFGAGAPVDALRPFSLFAFCSILAFMACVALRKRTYPW